MNQIVSVAAHAGEGGTGVPAVGADVGVGYPAFAAAGGEFRRETGQEISVAASAANILRLAGYNRILGGSRDFAAGRPTSADIAGRCASAD